MAARPNPRHGEKEVKQNILSGGNENSEDLNRSHSESFQQQLVRALCVGPVGHLHPDQTEAKVILC